MEHESNGIANVTSMTLVWRVCGILRKKVCSHIKWPGYPRKIHLLGSLMKKVTGLE